MTESHRALVTGGAGFIGSTLVGALVRLGWQVRVLDNFSTGKRANLNGIGKDRVEIVTGDIRNQKECEAACEGMTYVFHQAALRSVPRSVDDPASTNEVNVQGTLNMLQAAHKMGVRRLVYASSSSVYGDSTQLPQVESQAPAPISPYAVSKLSGEHYCQSFTKVYGLETVSLRYFNVFGPRQDPESKYSAVIPAFISQAARGEQLEIHWDGLQGRDFTYVDDIAQANVLAATAPSSVAGMAVNIANGRSQTILEVAGVIVKILGRDPGRRHTDRRQGDVRTTWANVDRAQQLLSFQPKIELEEGLRRTVEYFRSTGLLS